jgi:hypothetical protein
MTGVPGEVPVQVIFTVPAQWWLASMHPSDQERAVNIVRIAAANAAEATMRARWEDLK